MKKSILITIGTVSLIFGYIGVIMPLIPFTPFLILTAFCYAKSSDKLDKWFKSTKLYQDNLESFVKGEGMTKKAKCRVLLMISLVMLIGLATMLNKVPIYAIITLLVVWVGHIIYFVKFVNTKETAIDD